MRPEGNPLDLNNLPDDYSRDGKQVSEDSSPSGSRKKKSGGKDGKEECGKVYECRFCSLKFCKSQALGGHMNRHRQERETETLNRARHLVYSNDNLAAQGASHLGCQGYHPAAGHVGDPTLPFRSVYPPPRLYSGSTSTLLPQPPPPPPQPQPPQPYLYTSPSRLVPYPSQYSHHQHPINDYYVGHVLSSSTSQYPHPGPESNYTCIGAPVGHGFPAGGGRSSDMAGSGAGGGGRDGTLQHLDPHSINRFQERF